MMVSKKNKQPDLSGLVVVDKPLGVTSHDVVAAVRGVLHMRRVGHAGTLDPQASGVLVIGFGHGTRLLNYIVDHTKTYEATIRLGQTSTTDDSEGEITTVAPVRLAYGSEKESTKVGSAKLADDSGNDVAGQRDNGLPDLPGGHDSYGRSFGASPATGMANDSPVPSDGGITCAGDSGNGRVLTLQQIEQTIEEHLTGDIEQVPSSYSAVRINGRHAYELARQGKVVKLDARPVTISEFTVLGARNARTVNDEEAAEKSETATNAKAADGSAETINGTREAPHVGMAASSSNTRTSASDSVTDENESAVRATTVVDVDVRISCSTGTYIRSLGRDLGQLLGVGGYLTKLRRTRVGQFDLTDPQLAERVVTAHAKPHTFTNREGVTLTLNRAVLDVDADELKRRTLTMLEAAQRTMPIIPISDEDAQNLRFGRRLPMPSTAGVNAESHVNADETGATDAIAAVYLPQTDEVVGIVEPANAREMKSVVVFPPQ